MFGRITSCVVPSAELTNLDSTSCLSLVAHHWGSTRTYLRRPDLLRLVAHLDMELLQDSKIPKLIRLMVREPGPSFPCKRLGTCRTSRSPRVVQGKRSPPFPLDHRQVQTVSRTLAVAAVFAARSFRVEGGLCRCPSSLRLMIQAVALRRQACYICTVRQPKG